ncbi:YadA-like family protein [Moraxella osloensis]|uniref:YadA-like family protein n=1 Tax=Faucicola osloensis TaxID=34062 RepID=UPI0034DE4610
MVLNQAENVFTYSLNKDININSVQFNDGPKITNDGDNIKVGDKDGNATKITNVAAGTDDTDAVNMSQLEKAQAAATTKVEEADGINVEATPNADGSTTYTVSAKTDGTTTKIDGNGNIAAVTTTFTPSTDGKVGAPVGNGDSLVTANTVADAINNSGWKATSGATGSGVVDGTTEELINPSETVTFRAGDNMVLNQAENVFTYSLNKDININSVQFNDGPKITNDGDNIKVGDKDGNATKITNVAAGTDATDAVNMSQLEKAQAAATTKVEEADGINVEATPNADGSTTYTVSAKTDGTTTKIDGNGNIAAVTTTFTPSTDGKVGAPVGNGDSLVTANTVADAINNSGWKATSGATGSGVVAGTTEELINPSETVTFQAGDNMVLNQAGNVFTYSLNKDININSVQFNDGPKITNDGDNIKVGDKDGNATKITNVAAGTDDTDAVNMSQLEKAQAAATTKVEEADGIKVEATPNADGSTTYTVSAKTDGTTTKIDGNGNIAAVTTTFTPSTDGKVGAPVDNGDSLVTANTVADAINNSGWKATSGATGSGVVAGTTEELINPSETVTFQAGDNMVLNQAGNVFTYSLNKDININSVQFNDGPKITNDGDNIKVGDKDGNATKITNVKAGEADTDAVNVSQLKEAANNLVTTGFNIADGKGGNDNVKLGETVTFTDPAGNIITTVTDNKVEFGLNSTLSVGKDGEPGKVGIKGADGKDAISLNGEDGTIGLKGADGKDGISLNGKDGTIGINGKDGANATLTVEKAKPALDGKDGQNGEDGQTRIVYTKPNGSKEEVATLNDGLNFKADDGSIVAKKLNETLEIVGGADKDKLTDNNIGVNNKDGKLTVQLAKDLKGIDSITVNNGPVISGNGIDMKGDKITNVKAGTEDNDAVNVSQLKAVEATANQGWNLTTNGKADSKSNVKPGDTVDFANTDRNVKIENTGNNVTVNLNKDIDLTKDGSVTIGDTKVNNDGLTIVGGPSVTKSGIDAGDKKITKLADGEISATSKDAVNGSQLYTLQQAAVAAKTEVKAGDNVEVKKESGGNGQDIYTVSAKDTSASVTAGSDAITVNKADPKKVGTVDVTDYKVDLSQATKDNIQKGVDAKDIVDNKGLTFAGDNNSSTEVQKLGSTVNVNGDSNITTQASGNTVKVTLNPNVTVESLTATNSVNVGSGGAQVALTTNVGKDGVRELSVGSANAPTRITNVAPGVDATDAVNMNQLKDFGYNLGNKIDKVGDEANAGVSSAMAMAALPQAYIPGKSMATGGMATYNGQGAVAVGISKLSDNGRWVLKISGSADTEGNVGGAVGAGFHF